MMEMQVMKIGKEEIRWLSDFYSFIRESGNDEEDCTMGWENDKMIVNVPALRRGLRTLFLLIQGIEQLDRNVLPEQFVFGNAPDKTD